MAIAIADVLSLIFFILLLLVFFYGSNWQGWYAGRQILKSLRLLDAWRMYGLTLIQQQIEPLAPATMTKRDIQDTIDEMLNFFVIKPAAMDSPVYEKLRFIMSRREERFQQLIQNFLPGVDDNKVATIISLLNTTIEIQELQRQVLHNLLIGRKTKSYWFLLQTAAEITQTLLKGQAYRRALDAFLNGVPIGDSIGPLALQHFVRDIQIKTERIPETSHPDQHTIRQKISYRGRICYCLRAEGPASRVGYPGRGLEKLANELEQKGEKIHLLITIDAITRLEGELPGTVSQGIGVAVGDNPTTVIEKYQIESIAISQEPPIPVEAIVCKESLLEAVSPMTTAIENALPKILRYLKQIIRSQAKKGQNVVILGIGNAIGVGLE